MSIYSVLPAFRRHVHTGPGEYECKDTLGKSKPGLLCHRDGRFKPIDSRVPGPGAYTVSYTQMIGSSLHSCTSLVGIYMVGVYT